MADLSIKYKNNEIVSLSSSGTKTLTTKGRYCEDDIVVVYTKPVSSETPKLHEDYSYNVNHNGNFEIVPNQGEGYIGFGKVSLAVNVPQLDTSDANATSNDIVSGKSAYVNGVKVSGGLVINRYDTGSSKPSDSVGNDGDLFLIV